MHRNPEDRDCSNSEPYTHHRSSPGKKEPHPEILIVEDDGILQRLIADVFARHFKVTMARTAADAVDLYIQCAPDAMLLNIGLPDASGFDVLARLRCLDPHAYIVMLSGQASRENILRATELGARNSSASPSLPKSSCRV